MTYYKLFSTPNYMEAKTVMIITLNLGPCVIYVVIAGYSTELHEHVNFIQ
jgi:hypothetical protein